MPELRFRQVHLDFHTSEHLVNIGSEFDPERFVHTLKAAAVDSITCFSRCHHGWIYHDTRFPYRHPHLQTNLLEHQIRACHAADIRVPIYITVGWDDLMARLHPEWIEVDAEGRQVGRGPLNAHGGWKNLDFASPYVDFVIEQTQEVCDLFGDEVDGFFFDIIFQSGVHSAWCLDRYRQLGWDAANPAHQQQLRELVVAECVERIHAGVRAKNRTCGVFFNGGHVGPSFRDRLPCYTHLEVESLPTGGWGYMHFPITSRYTRTLNPEFLGMTGKFSEMWGHFNSYKNPAALEFECFSALAQGGKCSVGDQLPPTGVLDRKTYDLIGGVYRQIAEVEPWCRGARAVTEIAVLNAEVYDHSAERMDPRNLGAARILMEGRHQFDFIDEGADLDGYRVIVLPDVIPVSPGFAARLNAWVAAGGRILSSGTAGLTTPTDTASPLAGFPATFDGPREPRVEFLRPSASLVPEADTDTDFVMYEPGVRLVPTPGAQVWGTATVPLFGRNFTQFCSHAHTPPDHVTDEPVVVANDQFVHFAHPVFTTYAKHSMGFHRDIVLRALAHLLPQPLLRVEGPTSLQATLTRQNGAERVHLLHYIPERRGLNYDIVEDSLPLGTGAVTVRTDGPRRVTLVPQGTEVPATYADGALRFTLPPGLVGHQIFAFDA